MKLLPLGCLSSMVFLITSGVGAGTPPAAADGLSVWTTTATVHVLRESPPGEELAVHLFAARGQCRGFQVFLRSDKPVTVADIVPADLAGPGGARIPASAAVLYRQHQLHITKGTNRNDTFKPGWYPDPLIPFRHPITGQPLGGGRFVAVPFDLPANETHGFWIDIAVPRSANAGDYRGQYRVTFKSAGPVEVPVTLTVWDFELPATPTLVTAFGSPAARMKAYYAQRAKEGKEKGPTDWPAIETQCARLLAEHRFNASPPPDLIWPSARDDGSYRLLPERLAALRKFVDEYHVNAFQVSGPSAMVKDPISERTRFLAWLKALDEMARDLDRPNVLFYTYLIDEPNDKAAYDYVRKWGGAIRASKSVVKVMVTEQAQPQDAAWGDLYGAVDIWCPLFSLFDPENAAKRQALGEGLWAYTALCQGKKTPWWHIDWPLLNYRVPAWIAWRYGMTGLLYWGGMAYWNEVDDPWLDAWTYSPKKKTPVYNGEGTLVYPARAVGFDGIVPSLRLKALRDSIDDYEFLVLLSRLGPTGQAEATKIVNSVVTSWYAWDESPKSLEEARLKLAQRILFLSRFGPHAQPVSKP